jgi:RNA polymerase sigma-70 factor (ECF subfamily)
MNSIKEKIWLLQLKSAVTQGFSPDKTFEKIYKEYAPAIYRYTLLKVSNKEQAEDFASEVFLKFWKYITAGNKIKSLKSLLYSIARNLVIDHYRKKSQETLPIEELEITDPKKNPFEKIMVSDDIREAYKLLSKIKDEYREVLLLHIVEELSVKEIADVLDKSRGAVRVLLHRAKKTLREIQNPKSQIPNKHQ